MAAASVFVRHMKRNRRFSKLFQQSKTCFSTVPSTLDKMNAIAGDAVQYPPIKPKYPPGNWGEMNHKYAWLWQKTKDELMNIPDVKGRQDYLVDKEMTVIHLQPFCDHPDSLLFRSYVTKTCLLPWKQNEQSNKMIEDNTGTGSSDTDSDASFVGSNKFANSFENIKNALIDHILMDHYSVERGKVSISRAQEEKYCKRMIQCIADTFITHLSHNHEHLRTCQYDENVLVRALWDRHGLSRNRQRRLGVDDHFQVDEVKDQRITSACEFDGMLRSHLPLPQLEPREDGLSIEQECPVLPYKYSAFGITRGKRKLKNILAGHLLGDPCEFGLVGLLSTNRMSHIDQISPPVAQQCRLAMGLSKTFTWLAAQAINQGFNGYIDLTYPLTTQAVLTDGKNFSFLMYQLNTLELWKDNDANKMVNLCWHTQEMPLYDSIDEGKVIGFNDEVLKMLLQVFTFAPADRGYDMKPTIQEKETNLHLKQDFIPSKVEEIVEEEEEQYIVH